MGLAVRSIGLAHATARITLANLTKICAAWPGLRQEPDPPECSDRLQRPASHSGPKRT
jgi:hypothetical protein